MSHRDPHLAATGLGAGGLLRGGALAGIASLAFRTDLAYVLALGAAIESHPGYRVVRTPANPTYHWGNFLLLEQPPEPGTVSTWVEWFAEAFPDARHLALGVDGTDGGSGDAAELAASGLAVERNAVLTAQRLVAPRHPVDEGIELRALDTDADADWAAALQLILGNDDSGAPDYEPFARRSLELRRELQARGTGSWFGAFADGRMVSGLGVFAYGAGTRTGPVARYQTVDTLEEYRGRGLAGSLVHLAGQYALGTLGARTLVIVADPEYHAIRLYRSLGFADAETQVQLARA